MPHVKEVEKVATRLAITDRVATRHTQPGLLSLAAGPACSITCIRDFLEILAVSLVESMIGHFPGMIRLFCSLDADVSCVDSFSW